MQDPAHEVLGAQNMLEQAVAIPHGPSTVLIPCPTHRMIHLIAHAQISDQAYGLRDIRLCNALEAAVLAGRHPIDWTSVRNAFAQAGFRREVMAFLTVVEALFERIAPQLQIDRNARAWAKAALAGLDDPAQKGKRIARIVQIYARDLVQNPRRLRLLWDTLKNPARARLILPCASIRRRRISQHRQPLEPQP